jgi:hypothetical protein
MKRIGREAGFALLAWLIPFAFAFCIFPLKESHLPLFESLMGVAVSASTVGLAVWYFRGVMSSYVRHGARIGMLWMLANWLLDSLMFSSGPMKMSLGQYAMDIGAAYLAIPAITVGVGAAAGRAIATDSRQGVKP